MKLALRRIPFVLMVAIGGSYVLLRTVLPILSLFHVDIEINDNAVVFLYFATRAAFWTAFAAAFMIWRKGITRRYLRGNQAQLENVCQQLSAMPIRYLGTTLPRKFREQALQIGSLYFVPEENAPADCAARAAEITEPLFAALTESEKKALFRLFPATGGKAVLSEARRIGLARKGQYRVAERQGKPVLFPARQNPRFEGTGMVAPNCAQPGVVRVSTGGCKE